MIQEVKETRAETYPLISIITPSYNASSFIMETIRSVQSQSYTNWEMIVVDDLSKDNTRKIIKEEQKKDNRIKLIPLEENSGAAIARNIGIDHASGKYLAFLDSDDLWLPEKLEKQLEFMRRKNIGFAFTGYQIITQNGEPTKKFIQVPELIDYNGLLKNTIIGCLTVMIDVEKVGKVKMPNFRTRQDTATWLGILKQGHLAFGLNETLAQYRKVENSVSSKKINMAKMNWRLYREIEKLSIPKSVWCFINYAYNGFLKHKIK